MKNKTVWVTILAVNLLLAGCVTTTWDGVVLPDANILSFSPHLNWVTYERNSDLWLASLPDLKGEFRLAEAGDTSVSWSMHTWWMPNEEGFLITSYNYSDNTQTWWLVKTDSLGARDALCTLPLAECVAMWSPVGNAFVTIQRGGAVTLIHADGSGCEALPISGLVMLTPTLSWAPDGQKIAYIDVSRGGFNTDTAELRLLDLNTYQNAPIYDGLGLPVWFPDGQAIALIGAEEVIPVIRADGTGLIWEIEIPMGYVIDESRGTVWSPDGSRLALYLETEGSDYEPVAIGVLYQDTLDISVFEVPYFSEILGWTPDGSAVVVLASRDDGSLVLREEEVSP